MYRRGYEKIQKQKLYKNVMVGAIVASLSLQGVSTNASSINNSVESDNKTIIQKFTSFMNNIIYKTENILKGNIVNIPDANLKKLLNAALYHEEDEDIMKSDLANIKWLSNIGPEPTLSETNITNLEGLQYCVNLENLLIDVSNIKNLKPMFEIPSLKWIMFDEVKNEQLKGIDSLKNLESFNCEKLDSLEEISKVENLKTLICVNGEIKDIKPLVKLKKLEALWLIDNEIEDISSLENLKQLHALGLQDNNVKDIRALTNLKNIQLLNLDNNNITDISSLSNMEKLAELHLNENDIEDIKPLDNLPNLKWLFINNSEIYM